MSVGRGSSLEDVQDRHVGNFEVVDKHYASDISNAVTGDSGWEPFDIVEPPVGGGEVAELVAVMDSGHFCRTPNADTVAVLDGVFEYSFSANSWWISNARGDPVTEDQEGKASATGTVIEETNADTFYWTQTNLTFDPTTDGGLGVSQGSEMNQVINYRDMPGAGMPGVGYLLDDRDELYTHLYMNVNSNGGDVNAEGNMRFIFDIHEKRDLPDDVLIAL